MLLGLAIHIIANIVLKQMPPIDPTPDQLRDYLLAEQDSWAIVHGMRYPAMACIALFAAALYVRTSCAAAAGAAKGWGIFGLMGAMLMLANLLITNGIETFVFLDYDLLNADAPRFHAMFSLTRILWTAEIAAWSIFIFGFIAAGWSAHRLPWWICLLGLISSGTGILSACLIVPVLKDHPTAGIIIEIASLAGLLWFLTVGVYLIVRGDV